VKLRHPAFVLSLDERETVHACGRNTAHCLHALERAKPVQGKKCLIGPDPHDAAAAQLGEMQGVIRSESRVGVAGANEAHRPDRLCFEMLAEALVKREKRRLHGFHVETAMAVGGFQNLLKLTDVEGGGLFAQHMLAGRKRFETEFCMAVGVGGHVDGVNRAGQQVI
jgi:hypothetical protein